MVSHFSLKECNTDLTDGTRGKTFYVQPYLPEGRKSPRAKTNPNTTTATPTPICFIPKFQLVIFV